jgi:hypothetical protein
VPPHIKATELDPENVMGAVEPELVIVAEPILAVQLVDSGLPGQAAECVTVWVAAVAEKLKLPVTVVGVPPPQVRSKV